jgi:hypothetical protein
MPPADDLCLCPPHHWEVTAIRIEGVCHYHHRCIKCQAEKDVPLSASTPTKWVSRHSRTK